MSARLVHFPLVADDCMAPVEVEDNGPGVTGAVRRQLFEPVFTIEDIDAEASLSLSVFDVIARRRTR